MQYPDQMNYVFTKLFQTLIGVQAFRVTSAAFLYDDIVVATDGDVLVLQLLRLPDLCGEAVLPSPKMLPHS